MMRLYHSPASPFVRKVMIVLHETGQLDDVELVPTKAAPLPPVDVPYARNPLGKVPILEREDGPAIYDSRVITRYLDHRAGGVLYPEPPRLWETATIEATGDGIMEAALLMVYESRWRAEETRHEAWVESQWSKITRSIDALETRWISHLSGRFEAGHVAVAAALGYVAFRHGDREWRSNAPAVADWFDAVQERPSIAATKPPAGA